MKQVLAAAIATLATLAALAPGAAADTADARTDGSRMLEPTEAFDGHQWNGSSELVFPVASDSALVGVIADPRSALGLVSAPSCEMVLRVGWGYQQVYAGTRPEFAFSEATSRNCPSNISYRVIAEIVDYGGGPFATTVLTVDSATASSGQSAVARAEQDVDVLLGAGPAGGPSNPAVSSRLVGRARVTVYGLAAQPLSVCYSAEAITPLSWSSTAPCPH